MYMTPTALVTFVTILSNYSLIFDNNRLMRILTVFLEIILTILIEGVLLTDTICLIYIFDFTPKV